MSQTVFRYRNFSRAKFFGDKKMMEPIITTLGLFLVNLAIGLLIIQGD